ncbi:uncharacterized protein LOC129761217 [Toxorhynchites rutilus septentrionalis]|uniref:uncharacterized protein LOC129761217 n=1 Tax=Toxorhynchites rutilus septentrionalis TaxID=329112 RepID=UPI00247A5B84|nr:uncharacterized protein LOC129761217 [Toxorhynchites rutilus septentrionalis]
MASSSSGAGRPTNIYNGVPTTRTSPRWADPFGGNLQILLLRTTEGNLLPSNPFTVSKSIQGVIGKEFKDAKPQRDDKNRYIYKMKNSSNCFWAKPISSVKAVPTPSSNPQESELSTSSSDSESDPDISMEIETTPSNKRKNTNKRSTSDEFKSSEEEIFRGKEFNKKKSKNQKYNSTQPSNESKPSTSLQPSTSFQPTTASKTKTSNQSNHSNKPTPLGNKPIANVSKNDPRLKNKSGKSTHS